MGEPQKFQLSRINNIASAIQLIGDNTLLDAKIAYRLGLLGDYCTNSLKALEKERVKRIKLSNEARTELLNSKTGDKINDDKVDSKVVMINNDLSSELTELLEEEAELKIPELKLSDFTATKEMKQPVRITKDEVERTEVLIVEAGRPLVPVRFFSLMGDIIKE